MPRYPMLFPGQGSQAVGMAADLRAAGGTAAEFLASVDDILGCDLSAIMIDGPAEVLTETRNAQPAHPGPFGGRDPGPAGHGDRCPLWWPGTAWASSAPRWPAAPSARPTPCARCGAGAS